MAETKQEKRTFKWGDSEYLLDDLLKMHTEQENNYYNFARNRGQYDETALQGLRRAVTDRINAVKSGQAFDGDGVLSTDKVDNISIQTQKKGLFKKDKYVDQDNTEWAKYYLNKLVSQLKPYQKEAAKTSGDWDISKHGFEAYLKGQGFDAQDLFENYDVRDINNPDAARSFTQRDDKLREYLGKYKSWLEGKGFDFTKNDNEWDDNYMSTLNSVINGDWSDRTALAASLRKLGSGNFATAFTSDRWDLSKSKEELDTETKAVKEAKAAKVKSERMKKAQDAFLDNYKEEKGSYLKSADYTNYKFGEGVTPSFMNYYADLNEEQQKPYGTYLGTSDESWTKAYQTLMQSLRDGIDYTDNNKGIILQRYFEDAPNGFTDVGDGLYLINESINDMGEGYVYDPVSKYFQKRHISEFVNQNANVKKAYENLLYDYLNKTYGTDYDTRTYVSFKEGGILKAQLGAAVLRPYDVNEQYKEKSSKSGLDVETQKARDRYINPDNKSEANPNAGFTGAEIARLASIGADITSLFLDPITGVAVGLGSTLTNFGADIADDGFQWQDVKNLGVNAGFDLLGAIPIFGDAFGTGAKITKNLIKWAPRMMGLLAGYQGVKNFGGMMESWQKMASNDENAKMTVQDWRNIAQSISLVTGGVRATKNKATQNKMKQQAKVDGVVGVNVRDRATGEITQIIVDGDIAQNIRAAKGDRAKIEAELSKLDDFNGKFGESGTMDVATKRGGLQNPWQKVEGADGSTHREYQGFRKDGRAKVSDVYDFSKVPAGYSSGRGWKIPGVSDRLNQWHQDLMTRTNSKLNPTTVDHRGKLTNEAFEAEQTKLLNDQGVEAQIGKVKEAVEARRKSLAKTDEFISKAQSDLETQQRLAGGDDLVARQADAESRLRGLSSNEAINDAHNAVAHHTAAKARNKAKRAALSESRSKQLAQMEEGLNARVTIKKADIDALQARQKSIKRRLADGKPHPKLEAELNRVNSEIKKLNKEYRTLKRDTPTQIAEARARIQSQYQRAYTQLEASTKSSKGAIAKAQPIAAQRKAYSEAYAQQQAAILGQALQKRLNTLQGRKASHDPTKAHTHAFKELETMLNTLRASNPTIGGKTINWDMDAILQKYGVNSSDVFKEGGSINRNKINKFLNYAKG